MELTNLELSELLTTIELRCVSIEALRDNGEDYNEELLKELNSIWAKLAKWKNN
jgi:hypothetical protein